MLSCATSIYGVAEGITVGVPVSVGGMTSSVGVIEGVGVKVGAGVSEGVGVDEGTVGVGRLRLSLMRFSTSVLSPTKVKRSETIPFGTADKFHENNVSSFMGLSLSFRIVHDAGSVP